MKGWYGQAELSTCRYRLAEGCGDKKSWLQVGGPRFRRTGREGGGQGQFRWHWRVRLTHLKAQVQVAGKGWAWGRGGGEAWEAG